MYDEVTEGKNTLAKPISKYFRDSIFTLLNMRIVDTPNQRRNSIKTLSYFENQTQDSTQKLLARQIQEFIKSY